MEDWTTYRISDFLLFTRDVLYDVHESYNRAIWPMQIGWIFVGMVLLALVRRRDPLSARLASGILAMAWCWTGWIFHLRYFVPINWAAKYFAGLFFFETSLLIIFGVVQGRLRFGRKSKIGFGLLLLAVLAPIGLLLGQSFSQLLLFGWGPTHTALGTVGALLLAQDRGLERALLMIPATMWCLISALMHWGLME